MARHTIQIPIIKSSNDNQMVIGSNPDMQFIPVPRVSNSLYIAQNCRIGVGWDGNQIPKNKNIVSQKVCLYANGSLTPRGGFIKMLEFGEGSALPSPQPSDRTFTYISSGWNKFDIPITTPVHSAILGIWFDLMLDYFDYTTFNSHRASNNKPYLEIIYDDIPPDKPSSLYPNGVTVNPRDVIRFAWSHNSKEGNEQKGFTLQYSLNGGTSWTTVNQTTPNQFYDMPANTLPTSGTVLWRVRTIDGNDEISEYTTASFTLGIVPQKAPIPISPISQYIDENNPIRFEWNFTGGSDGETQSKFDLQYSSDGGSTWTTKTVATSNQYYELPAGTLSSGNITWRVRTYNNWNEVSPYSENRSFTVIGSPPIPLISNISNSGRPTINWQSTDQHIYELEILKDDEVIFDSGSIPSTSDRSFKLENYLPDGNYKAKLRIYNEYNLFSPWAERNFTISTVKPQKPIIEVFNGEYSVTIKVSNTSARTLVYRDNILIGEVEGDTFVDYTGENKKEYQYFARTIDVNENFSDSDIKLARCKFSGNTLALADRPEDFVKLRYGYNERPKKTNSFGVNGNLVYYDGRKYPVVEYSEFEDRVKTLTFVVRTLEEVERIEEMMAQRKTFLYRDNKGKNIYGTILNIGYEEVLLGYEINLTITKIDYKGVAYD